MSQIIKRPNLLVKQFKTACLAQYAYLVESSKEIALVDPLRDVAAYMDYTKENSGRIKWILETHYHADFVSGFLDLAKKSNGTIVFGPNSNPSFPSKVAQDGERLVLGSCSIRVLHTPGHTLESSSYVLEDEDRKPLCVFTGDTLFLGDVGRPDLAQKVGQISDKDLAAMLFRSLKKLKTLPDECLILPGHGAGSSCGKNISPGDICDIGTQKIKNLAFAENSEAAFIDLVTTGLQKPPSYFGMNVAMNKEPNVI